MPSSLHDAATESQPPKPDLNDAHARLTPRQIEVLALAARGESSKSIARLLGISLGTVKTHLTAVYKTLNVKTRTRASLVAARMPEVDDEQVRKALDGQLSIANLLSHETKRRFTAGTVIFKKGEITDALYLVVRGTVYLEELGIERGPGELLGEVSLFSSDHRRMATARCKTDCDLLSATPKDAMRIYIQDPAFALYVTQLLTRRLHGGE
jgi:two-component system nitrate/nitrite response regulator NarL